MNRIKLILIAFVLITSTSIAIADNVSGWITTDETWTELGSPYNVTSSVTVSGATLTIEPGVTVSFSEGTWLWVGAGGKLLAEGTSDNKITFTGTEKIPGHWKGIIFGPFSNDASVINNAIIEYGGGKCLCEGKHRYANIITGGAAPTITNSTIRNSGEDGILCMRRSLVSGSTSTTTEARCCPLKDPTIICNWITNNTNGVHTIVGAEPAINNNNICGNFDYGVLNTKLFGTPPTVNAINNWWGDSNGPGGVGPGNGDNVSDYVDYSGYTAEPVPCAPIPELSSVILVAAGLLMLAGYVRIGRRD